MSTINLNIKCDFDLKKNGSMKNRPILNDYKKILCVIKNSILFELIFIPLNEIYGKNESEIIYNLLILKYAQKNDLKFLKYKKVNYIFYEKNASNIFLLLYWNNSLFNDKEFEYFYGKKTRKYVNLKKLLSSAYFDYKLKYINESDNEICIRIFYNTYVVYMLKTLKKNFSDFPNFHQLYLYIKKNNLVKKYYEYYVPIMKNNFNKFYKRILKDPLNFELYKRDQYKNIKSFRDININKIIKKLNKSTKKIFTKMVKQLNLE
jgi:hypothetical protein